MSINQKKKLKLKKGKKRDTQSSTAWLPRFCCDNASFQSVKGQLKYLSANRLNASQHLHPLVLLKVFHAKVIAVKASVWLSRVRIQEPGLP